MVRRYRLHVLNLTYERLHLEMDKLAGLEFWWEEVGNEPHQHQTRYPRKPKKPNITLNVELGDLPKNMTLNRQGKPTVRRGKIVKPGSRLIDFLFALLKKYGSITTDQGRDLAVEQGYGLSAANRLYDLREAGFVVQEGDRWILTPDGRAQDNIEMYTVAGLRGRRDVTFFEQLEREQEDNEDG